MRRLALAVTLVSALAPSALAQSDTDTTDIIAMGGDYTYETWPVEVTRRPLLLAPGLLELDAALGISLSRAAVFKPVMLATSAHYGASNHFTAFLSNDPGLCLGGSSACPSHEQNLALGTLVGLIGTAGTPVQVGALVDLHVDAFSPFALGIRISGPTRLLLPHVALELAPGFTIALNGPGARQRERLEAPLELQVQLSHRLALLLDTGVAGPVSNLSTVTVPVALGLEHSLSRAFDLGARFGFPNLLGKGATADVRSLQLFVKYRR